MDSDIRRKPRPLPAMSACLAPFDRVSSLKPACQQDYCGREWINPANATQPGVNVDVMLLSIALALSAALPEDEAIRRVAREEARTVLSEVLTERERTVVMLRCGFGGGAPTSFDVIGRRLGVTRERVRQIEVEALRKLRQSDVAARLGADGPQRAA